jgi:hypothetical protein
MLVDVRCLRANGIKLAREVVHDATPHRGQLHIGRVRGPTLYAWLLDSSYEQILPQLADVRVLRVRDDHLLVAGYEQHDKRQTRRLGGRSMPQVWWARVVRLSAPTDDQ